MLDIYHGQEQAQERQGCQKQVQTGATSPPGKRDKPSIDRDEAAGEETGVTTVDKGGGRYEKLTLEAIDAISDEEDDSIEEEEKGGVRRRTKGAGDADEMEEEGDGDDDDEAEAEEWNAEARALRQAIAEGAFDKIPGVGGSGERIGQGGESWRRR